MIIQYKGYEVEGTIEEIKKLVGIRKPYNKHRKPGAKLFKMTDAHKEAIRMGIKKAWRKRTYKPKGKYRKVGTDKRRRWTAKEKNNLIKLKLGNNMSYKNIAENINKSTTQIKDKISNMKKCNTWPKR